MPAIRKPSEFADITLEQRRDEIIAILAVALVQLSGGGGAPGENRSESGETCLEVSGETSLTVAAG